MNRPRHPTNDGTPVLGQRYDTRDQGRMLLLREKASRRGWLAATVYVENVKDWA